jgi:hypothetical protein
LTTKRRPARCGSEKVRTVVRRRLGPVVLTQVRDVCPRVTFSVAGSALPAAAAPATGDPVPPAELASDRAGDEVAAAPLAGDEPVMVGDGLVEAAEPVEMAVGSGVRTVVVGKDGADVTVGGGGGGGSGTEGRDDVTETIEVIDVIEVMDSVGGTDTPPATA